VCAGDGPYTALAVARECGMIDLGSTVALGHTGQVLYLFIYLFLLIFNIVPSLFLI
jgi:magnesium-transporting ATPase (P-type)